ncbi:hypothetical protein [Rhodopirellula sp. MGV]|uniref:hypothetical protein n=1 Tax=Rhodopirellula sp. MGV TaxID=2023130 RepID=UPI000B97C7CB|nr:hypothetical protein [Rhodopirellula sp. MGV]OYP29960.1 hypothetical protein CGZ80_23345 [Rhodopirellula sp. MGV]PNY33416.1 hypothetical protein C2E31_28360 [Rhodopirellula baltica]
MTHKLTRRRFASTGGLLVAGGLATGLANQPQYSFAAIEAIEQQRLIELGLNALARSPDMNYFADGHRGAAMISAHLMCVNNQFDDQAAQRINQLFNLNWANSKLCQPFAEGDRVEDATEQVGKALAEGSGVLREVGHDAIFAMHAIKGFRMMPQLATQERVTGVCELLRSIKPWRDVAPDPSIEPPPFSNAVEASRFVLQEASDAIDRFSGFGQGFAGHMLTFGQSLIEMAAMGDVEWAESCRVAFCKYVTVTRQGPKDGDRKIKDHRFSKLRPDDTEYWQQRGDKTLGIGHVFKYPYAYYDLLSRANSPELRQSFDAKAWQLF